MKHIALVLCLILGGIATVGAAEAAQLRPGDRADMPAISHVQRVQPPRSRIVQRQAQNNISYAQAKSIARRKVPGSQVIDISLNGQKYRVRLQTRDGRVVDVYVDAVTGRVQ